MVTLLAVGVLGLEIVNTIPWSVSVASNVAEA
jgi:hypothetical protein